MIEDHDAAEGFLACRPQRSVVGAMAPVVKEALIYFLKSKRSSVRGLKSQTTATRSRI
jgi:hypothetical protein